VGRFGLRKDATVRPQRTLRSRSRGRFSIGAQRRRQARSRSLAICLNQFWKLTALKKMFDRELKKIADRDDPISTGGCRVARPDRPRGGGENRGDAFWSSAAAWISTRRAELTYDFVSFWSRPPRSIASTRPPARSSALLVDADVRSVRAGGPLLGRATRKRRRGGLCETSTTESPARRAA